MDTYLCTDLLYGISPDGGTVESTKFKWDEMNDPFLSWRLHNLLEIGQILV